MLGVRFPRTHMGLRFFLDFFLRTTQGESNNGILVCIGKQEVTVKKS